MILCAAVTTSMLPDFHIAKRLAAFLTCTSHYARPTSLDVDEALGRQHNWRTTTTIITPQLIVNSGPNHPRQLSLILSPTPPPSPQITATSTSPDFPSQQAPLRPRNDPARIRSSPSPRNRPKNRSLGSPSPSQRTLSENSTRSTTRQRAISRVPTLERPPTSPSSLFRLMSHRG